MSKVFPLYVLSLLALLLTASVQAHGQNAWASSDCTSHNVVWTEKLSRQIEFLSDSLCAGRATGSTGNTEAAFWLIRSFRKSGLIPFNGSYAQHIYAGNGLVGHNILGMIPGSVKNPKDSYIIVGAHFDHLGILGGNMYPGADSNASGTVALTTLAEIFSSMKTLGRVYGKNIIFIAFDGYFTNLAGSYSFWKTIADGYLNDPLTGNVIKPEDISLMVNIDQIGCSLSTLKSGRKDYIIMLGNSKLHPDDRDKVSMCNLFYGTDLEIAHTYYGSKDFTRVFYSLSDQRVFVENKVPSVLFTSGITMNNNKTFDTPDTIDADVLRKRIILIFHWLEKMSR